MNKNDAADGNFTGTIKFEDIKKEGILIKVIDFTDGDMESSVIDIEKLSKLITKQQEKNKINQLRAKGAE